MKRINNIYNVIARDCNSPVVPDKLEKWKDQG